MSYLFVIESCFKWKNYIFPYFQKKEYPQLYNCKDGKLYKEKHLSIPFMDLLTKCLTKLNM